jgi:hypothetical protein
VSGSWRQAPSHVVPHQPRLEVSFELPSRPGGGRARLMMEELIEPCGLAGRLPAAVLERLGPTQTATHLPSCCPRSAPPTSFLALPRSFPLPTPHASLPMLVFTSCRGSPLGFGGGACSTALADSLACTAAEPCCSLRPVHAKKSAWESRQRAPGGLASVCLTCFAFPSFQAGGRGHVTGASLFANSLVPGVNPPSNHYGVLAEIRY